MGHREPPEIEPDGDLEARPTPRRRLAGLVGTPAARRVALPRLALAGAVVLVSVVLLGIGGSWLVRSAVRYVDGRPEHQIRFADIELSPSPDPWVKGGAPRILDEVRKESGHGEMISLLDIDLKALAQDFRRCPWVKAVRRVDRSRHGRLVVEVEYRKPVAAVVELPRKRPDASAREAPRALIVDDEAVILDDRDVLWSSRTEPIRVEGMGSPLVMIRIPPGSMPPPRLGLPWKRDVVEGSTDDADPMMLRAARLARFLLDRKLAAKAPGEAPDFASIFLPPGPDHPFFIRDAGQNWVKWGTAPGFEKPGEPSAEARWRMLLAWVREHGPLSAKGKDCLEFDATSARLYLHREQARD